MKLTKSQRAELQQLKTQLTTGQSDLKVDFEQLLKELSNRLYYFNTKVMEYNEHVGRARDFAKKVLEDLHDEYDEKSERWQESEAGQAAQSMIDEWESLDLDPIEEVRLLPPDAPDFGIAFDPPEEPNV